MQVVMVRVRKTSLVVWLVAAMMAALGVTARGQAVQGDIVSVGIGGMNGREGIYRVGCWTPVLVELRNRSGADFTCRLGVEQIDLDGDKVMSLGPKVTLSKSDVEGRLCWTYFWPRPDDMELRGITSVVVLDESGSRVVATVPTPGERADATGLPTVDSSTRQSIRWVVVLGKQPLGWASFRDSYGGTEHVAYCMVSTPNRLPDNVLGLDGVDVIVWQADQVTPSDLPPEFQLKAMLDWVKAGGHLIISVGTQGQEFVKAGSRLAEAMPLTLTGTRTMKLADLPALSSGRWVPEAFRGSAAEFTQVVGSVRPGARAVYGTSGGAFAEHPLAVTGLYGQGAVTVVTFDVGQPDFQPAMTDASWMRFWDQMAGWQPGMVMDRVEHDRQMTAYDKAVQRGDRLATPPVSLPREFRLGESIPSDVDVTDVTQIRILVALLFLAIYWLAAGPIGHLLLKQYHIVHWSWWAFGGVVLVATCAAGAVVVVLHVATYDLRHRTFVVGTVNSPQATVTGYYGVYAPRGGLVEVKQPETPGGGMSYLVPLCNPTLEPVRGFADPQSYQIIEERPWAAWPVFRNTLKKMQGRWTGECPGLTGSAVYGASWTLPLTGELTNKSGYDLWGVRVIVYNSSTAILASNRADGVGQAFLYDVRGVWRAGEKINLAGRMELARLAKTGAPVQSADFLLRALGRRESKGSYGQPFANALNRVMDQEDGDALSGRQEDDLLYVLSDARYIGTDELSHEYQHIEMQRGLARTVDCTKSLHAAGALVVARAGNLREGQYVKCPVPISVDGRLPEGRGEVLFAWALPVSGAPPQRFAPAELPGPETPARGLLNPGIGGGQAPTETP